MLARHEGDFGLHGEEPLSLDELLSMLGHNAGGERSREDAIACYLSAADGWSEAVKLLGGTFAARSTRLKGRKDD